LLGFPGAFRLNATVPLEVSHNRQRRHSSSLGMLTPIEFENTFTVA
jgi:hypothetical protein